VVNAATLLLRKSTKFHDKKSLDLQRKTLDYKNKLTLSEMPRKCVAMPTIDIVQTHWKPETKKMGDSSNAGVCLYRSLKVFTDDQVTTQRFNSKHIILSCVI